MYVDVWREVACAFAVFFGTFFIFGFKGDTCDDWSGEELAWLVVRVFCGLDGDEAADEGHEDDEKTGPQKIFAVDTFNPLGECRLLLSEVTSDFASSSCGRFTVGHICREGYSGVC